MGRSASGEMTKEEARFILRLINKGDFRSTTAYRMACRVSARMWDIVDPPKRATPKRGED